MSLGKIQNQQKALQGNKKSDTPVTMESVLHEMNEVEVELISESFIDQVVEEFFVEFAIENELTEDEIDTLVAEMTLEINESLILTEETDVLLNEKLGMVKKAIKAAGSVAKKAVVGGAGLAGRVAGTAVRAAKKAGKNIKNKDYDHKDRKFKSVKANRGNDGKGTKKEK